MLHRRSVRGTWPNLSYHPCMGKAQFAPVSTEKNCVFTTKPIRGIPVPRPVPLL